MAELLEVVLESTISNQQFVNRWNYLASGTPSAVSYSFALLSALGFIFTGSTVPADTLFNAIVDLVSPALVFEQAIAKNIYDVEDFYDRPFVGGHAGETEISGDDMPAFNAYGFRTSRVRSDIRRATKRFGGMREGANVTGGNINPSILVKLTDVADKMSEVVEYDDEGNTLTFSPVVVSKFKYTVPGSSPARYAYRYYGEDEGGKTEQLLHIAEGGAWEPYNTVRSQMSRQIGRGQ